MRRVVIDLPSLRVRIGSGPYCDYEEISVSRLGEEIGEWLWWLMRTDHSRASWLPEEERRFRAHVEEKIAQGASYLEDPLKLYFYRQATLYPATPLPQSGGDIDPFADDCWGCS